MQIWDKNAVEKGLYKKGLIIAAGFILVGILNNLFFWPGITTLFLSGPLLMYRDVSNSEDGFGLYVFVTILAFMILPLFFSRKSIVPWTVYFVSLWFLIGGLIHFAMLYE
jgi:hypothetical protein